MIDGPIDLVRRTRSLHLLSGMLIAVFVIAHIANHIAMFAGQATHIAWMDTLRPFYRNIVVEALLMASLAFQILSGLAMIWRTRSSRAGLIPWLQAISGIVLALFIANHVIAVWTGRIIFGLDTNYHFAAAGFHAGLAGFFVPYYFLGVCALFVHFACALTWRLKSRVIPVAVAALGTMLAGAFVAVMAVDPAIPAPYLETYQ